MEVHKKTCIARWPKAGSQKRGETKSMNDNTQITADTNSNAEPNIPEAALAITETPAETPNPKKTARATKSVKAAKPAKPIKRARAPRADKVEGTVAPAEDEAARTVQSAKVAKKVNAEKTAKSTKPAKHEKATKTAKTAAVTKTSKAAKLVKSAETAKPVKPTKVARSTKKIAKGLAAAIPKAPGKVASKGRRKGVRHTTNELNRAAKKAGLTVELTPLPTKPVTIGRGPAREFKIDTIVAHLRGSNGELIRDRGPGTPYYNDAESLAAVEIFEEFRGRTFHNKLKVEIR
jgi:hypothetical protein